MTLYQSFLDHAIAQLEQHLDVRPYPIPPGFETKTATVGKGKHQNEVQTDSYGACTPTLRQIRAAHVKGGSALQVLNFVIFPRLNYDLPFFGADLVTLPGGHLIAIDMQPLFRDDPAYRSKYADPLMAMFERYQQHLPWGGDFPRRSSGILLARLFMDPSF